MTGNMSDKQSYIKFKNDVMLNFINKPEKWISNKVKEKKNH